MKAGMAEWTTWTEWTSHLAYSLDAQEQADLGTRGCTPIRRNSSPFCIPSARSPERGETKIAQGQAEPGGEAAALGVGVSLFPLPFGGGVPLRHGGAGWGSLLCHPLRGLICHSASVHGLKPEATTVSPRGSHRKGQAMMKSAETCCANNMVSVHSVH